MTTYYARKRAAAYNNSAPSLTDQAGARDTDINVIVGRMGISGTVPGKTGEPLYEDTTNIPMDLRERIETARSIQEARASLPKELRDLPIEELLGLTPDKLTAILTPPEPPANPPKEGDK